MKDTLDETVSEQAAIFAALSDPTRLRLVRLLCQASPGALCVNALAARLGVSQSAVSQHLRVLKGIDLVKGDRQGYWVHYSINPEAVERSQDLLRAALVLGEAQNDAGF